jgi:predicted ribosomally synthesized peptide with SipW-like signal peptide
MKTMKSTKRALLASVVALFLCFSMLLGTTYAWFTASVASGSNVITAGNLDIKVEYTLNGKDWKALDGANDLFQMNQWEPGHTEVIALRITNDGSLALKYAAHMNIINEVVGTNKANEPIVLSDILNVSTLTFAEAGVDPLFGFSIAEKTIEEAFKGENNVAYNAAVPFKSANVLEAEESLKPGDIQYVLVKVDMADTIGNEANAKDKDSLPSIEFGIDVLATQSSYEKDSFGSNYDANASLPTVITKADELAAALTANEKNIAVTLFGDVDLPISSLGQITGGSGEYKLGGEQTETIVIDLNGHKLNITTTYWSNLGAKNPNATFIIKDGTMTSSQPTGTWNSYDLTFSNCDYVFENVTFDKAIAFDNEGKSVTMTNVTINETHDYYAMWITAEGQNVTIDGLTINSNGRGIKIDEQYVDAAAKVTLNVSNAKFNTAKKAAIMVKSAAGADIALNNVNIANTIDSVHAVWVDEDAAAYADLVTVTGGEKICEADVVANASELTAAVAAGKTNLFLLPGEYNVANCGKKTLTISGTKDTILKLYNEGEDGCDYGFDGSTVTFNGITINTTANTGNYKGYARLNATFNDCTFFGAYAAFGENTFNNCSFDFNNGYFWVWGAPTLTFNGCEFGGNSKAILAHGRASTVININNCHFNATEKGFTGAGDNTAVVEIDPIGANVYTINFTGENTKTDNYNGWVRVKDGTTGHTVNGLN